MKSIVGSIVDAVASRTSGLPVSFNPRGQQLAMPSGRSAATLALLGAMGSNGTLFSVVNTTTNATSSTCWHLYRKSRTDDPADRKMLTSHVALDLWTKPNFYSGQNKFVKQGQQHVDLVGEGWIIVSHNVLGWPDGLFVVRPDRMFPVPNAADGVSGYIYMGPNGEQIPLATNEVLRITRPNPQDPGPAGRGMGFVQSIINQVESVYYATQYNRNFFINSAVPGGVISAPSTLDDKEFDRLRMQWGENHKGVSAASRVAILENGMKWEDSSLNQKDMQFIQMLAQASNSILEAAGVSKYMLGQVDDVNRATAEALGGQFGTWVVKPRLDDWKDLLNNQLLPQFGATGHGTGQVDVEFDYDSPIPPDIDTQNTTLTAQTQAYAVLVSAGVDPDDAAQTCGLPKMKYTVKAQPQQPALVGGES